MKPSLENDNGPMEISRIFEEAIRCLKDMDLAGANAALKKVHAEAAEPAVHGGTGLENRPDGKRV